MYVAGAYNIGKIVVECCKEMDLYWIMWQQEHKKVSELMVVIVVEFIVMPIHVYTPAS